MKKVTIFALVFAAFLVSCGNSAEDATVNAVDTTVVAVDTTSAVSKDSVPATSTETVNAEPVK